MNWKALIVCSFSQVTVTLALIIFLLAPLERHLKIFNNGCDGKTH